MSDLSALSLRAPGRAAIHTSTPSEAATTLAAKASTTANFAACRAAIAKLPAAEQGAPIAAAAKRMGEVLPDMENQEALKTRAEVAHIISEAPADLASRKQIAGAISKFIEVTAQHSKKLADDGDAVAWLKSNPGLASYADNPEFVAMARAQLGNVAMTQVSAIAGDVVQVATASTKHGLGQEPAALHATLDHCFAGGDFTKSVGAFAGTLIVSNNMKTLAADPTRPANAEATSKDLMSRLDSLVKANVAPEADPNKALDFNKTRQADVSDAWAKSKEA